MATLVYSYYIRLSIRFLFDPANTSTKHVSPYIMAHLVKVFAIATALEFVEFFYGSIALLPHSWCMQPFLHKLKAEKRFCWYFEHMSI